MSASPEESHERPKEIDHIGGIISLVECDLPSGEILESSGQGSEALAELIPYLLDRAARCGAALGLENLREMQIYGRSLCTLIATGEQTVIGAVLKKNDQSPQVINTIRKQLR